MVGKVAPITFYTGPMFAEKSASIINRISRAQRANKKVLAIKPKTDNRDKARIVTELYNPETKEYVERAFPAHFVDDNDPVETIKIIQESRFDVFVADEVQFFGEWFVDLVRDLAWHEDNLIGGWAPWRRGYSREEWEGKEVVLGGLDLDALRNPFGITPRLLSVADEVIKLTADCFVEECENKARFTKRMIPFPEEVEESDPRDAGGEDKYEARCGEHWSPPPTS